MTNEERKHVKVQLAIAYLEEAIALSDEVETEGMSYATLEAHAIAAMKFNDDARAASTLAAKLVRKTMKASAKLNHALESSFSAEK